MHLKAVVGIPLVATVSLFSQVATPPLAFDVASIKATQHGRTADGSSRSSLGIPSPGRFLVINASLGQCIRWAYEVRDYQVAGPSWLDSDTETYDIEAKAPPQTSTAQVRLMLQTLLADRFKLRLHRDTKMLQIYLLLTGKNGPKLRGGTADGHQSTSFETGRINARNITMAGLASLLSRETGRPVLDKTEVSGAFDLTLDYAPESDVTGRRPSIYTALQEQVGLRLEATRGPVEVLFIDHAERPSEN